MAETGHLFEQKIVLGNITVDKNKKIEPGWFAMRTVVDSEKHVDNNGVH